MRCSTMGRTMTRRASRFLWCDTTRSAKLLPVGPSKQEPSTPDAPIRHARGAEESTLPRLGGRGRPRMRALIPLGEDNPPASGPVNLGMHARGGPPMVSRGGVSFNARIPGLGQVVSDTRPSPASVEDSTLMLQLAQAQAQLAAKEAELRQLRGAAQRHTALPNPPVSLWEPPEGPPLSRPSVLDRLEPRPSAFDRLSAPPPSMPTNATMGRQPGMDRAMHDFFMAGGESWQGPRTGQPPRGSFDPSAPLGADPVAASSKGASSISSAHDDSFRGGPPHRAPRLSRASPSSSPASFTWGVDKWPRKYCFNWQSNKPCSTDPCHWPHTHVCRWCGDPNRSPEHGNACNQRPQKE
ncbi:hypothetical protein KFL_002340150 [Klebsormidium nitens]|uniref:C3H1-type domain-containing protein n=1 Tax=Klebsormidium nitens TaxID=105231 RepID=A0A1Y1I3B3_KLENI|nr:hypothetical protein KFL_002340150 [Klebsormidium nitens]|eukprot:GAQ85425.1 hypothetical protein KFL_002340150 [Klebsormidium nitens]